MSVINDNQNTTNDKNNSEMKFDKEGRFLGLKSKTTGDIIIKLDYDNPDNFREGFASFGFKGKDNVLYYGFVHLSKKYEISPIYHTVRDFSEGFAFVKIGNKYGFIRKDGSFLMKPKYGEACDFCSGYACIETSDKIRSVKVGRIDTNGNEYWDNEYYN